MTIDIYPAFVTEGKVVTHADDWNPESTLNVANANFYSLADELNLSHLMTAPGHITLKTLETAMQMHRSPRYHERLKKICAIAHIKKARYIAFA